MSETQDTIRPDSESSNSNTTRIASLEAQVSEILKILKGKRKAPQPETDSDPDHDDNISGDGPEPEPDRQLKRPRHHKEPVIPLPEAYDGNPKHLEIFLDNLNLCFEISPSRYAKDSIKIATAGRLCANPKVHPWWVSWRQRWRKNERGYSTWDDFEQAIRARFKDHMEQINAREKLKRTKQTSKLSEYISLMQSTNLVAGYSEEVEWEYVFDGLKPKL